MISRTMDAGFLNRIANDPSVRPYIGGEGPVDLTPILESPANYGLVTEHGGWVLQAVLPGAYELHTLMLPEGRGEAYFTAAQEALRWMFTRTDCLEILTKCPDDNPAARMAAIKVGFRERFRREDAWAPGVGISYQALTLDGWIARDPEIQTHGEALLKEVHEATGAPYVADEAHERLVGAAVLMIRGGQTSKAIGVHNRTAVFAGFPTILALADNIIDVRGAIVAIKDDGYGVMLTS